MSWHWLAGSHRGAKPGAGTRSSSVPTYYVPYVVRHLLSGSASIPGLLRCNAVGSGCRPSYMRHVLGALQKIDQFGVILQAGEPWGSRGEVLGPCAKPLYVGESGRGLRTVTPFERSVDGRLLALRLDTTSLLG